MNDWFAGQRLVGWTDAGVLAALLAALVGVGFVFRGRQTDTREFFLGGRRLPSWAACLSFVATEVSAVTIISVPAVAFGENWEYLQFFIGSAAARLVIAFLFIPAFYRYDCTTIYQFLGHRFGRLTQVMGSLFFFLTRLLGSGVRLMAACLALSVLLGWDILPCIAILTVVSVVYIALGGISAVVWTNVLQAVVFLGGGSAVLAFIVLQSPGGAGELVQRASSAGRLAVLDMGGAGGGFWKELFSNPNFFWLAVLNGLFGSLAAFGTDHDLMQRLLTLETRRESQRTMALTIPFSLGTLLLYLSLGTALYGFYAQHPGLPLPDTADKIFPHFIGHSLPPLLRGLMMSAIVLASIDSPLASLSASFVTDIWGRRPWNALRRRFGLPPGGEASEADLLRLSRICVVVFGLVLAALAYGFSHFQGILWLAFKIGGVTFGSLLGVFLLGLLTHRKADRANAVAMVASAVLNASLLYLSETKVLPLGWSWLVILGTVTTFVGGYVLAPRLDRPRAEPA
jgi:SSS family transporter